MKKLITLSLVVIVLIAGVFCLNIGAEGDEPSVVISGHNLTLENNIYIVYYLQAENIPEGAEYGLLVWSAAQDSYTYANANYRLATCGTQTIGGVVYDRFEYQNVAAKQMADDIYAMGYIKDGDNITYSALDKYSVLKYAHNKLNNVSTKESLRTLLNGMLSYGTVAQTYFEYNIDRLANAVYYTVTVNSGTLADGTTSGLYQEGDSITVIAPKTNANGLFFSHWENSGKNKCSASTTYELTVGASDETYTAVYTDTYVDIWDGSIATGFAGGSGTEEDPYLISTGAQLAYLAYEINSNSSNTLYNKHYKLTNSIDLNGLEWDPIGCYNSGKNSLSYFCIFGGIFDGNGYSVSNYNISAPIKDYYKRFGLFGRVEDATVKNLTIKDAIIDITSSNADLCVGIIAGDCETSSIINCAVNGNIKATALYETSCGGITGRCEESTIQNCYSICNISTLTGTRPRVGGITGSLTDGKLLNCYAVGALNVTHNAADYLYPQTYIGGIVGCMYGTVNITNNCFATNNISVTSRNYIVTGGIAGETTENAISNSYSYENQIFSITNNKSTSNTPSNKEGLLCTLAQLNSSTFYTDTLGWSTNIWDFSDLDFENGKYPVFKEKSEYSVGLEYALNDDGESYSVTGIGTCTDTDIIIPNTYEGKAVTVIGKSCFSGKSDITSITIPDSITNIEKSAFKNCTGLTKIYYNAIECANLAQNNNVFYKAGRSGDGINVVIGANVKKIPAYLFCPYSSTTSYWPNIVSVEFKKGSVCEKIGESAFEYCEALINITIPDSVTVIDESAFSHCKGLTGLSIGKGVVNISSNAFARCTALTYIYYNAVECADFTENNGIFSNVGQYGNGIEIVIGKNTKKIPAYLFCPGTIGLNDFDTVTSVTFETDSVCKYIGDFAFSNCFNLKNIEIGEKVESIGNYAFYACSELATITIKSASTIIYDSEYTIYSSATIYGYTGSTAEAYATKYNRTFVLLSD